MFDSRAAIWFSALACAVIAVCSPPAASARDRPGTPNSVGAWECTHTAHLAYDVLPSVCVTFMNTADEPVTFGAEWTINGVLQTQPVTTLITSCTVVVATAREGCDAAFLLHPSAKPLPVRRNAPQVVTFSRLSFDTEYCFRFEAINMLGVVSEIWSQRVCARTMPQPPLPPAPTNVQATILPAVSGRGTPGPGTPPRVLVEWDADDSVVAWYHVQRFYGGWSPTLQEARDHMHTSPGIGHEEVLPTTQQDLDANAFGVNYRVCAVNFTGETCSAPASSSTVGHVDRPNHDATKMNDPYASQRDTRPPGADVLLPPSENGQVGRPKGGFGTEMTVPGGQVSGRSSACDSGFVWRVARAEDLVCVTPAARKRIARENADAANHVDPAGAYGPNTCVGGYVWRDAFNGDLVCVTPEARALAHQENAEAQGHRVDAGEVFRAPH